MRSNRTLLSVFALVFSLLFLFSCSRAYSAGQREPDRTAAGTEMQPSSQPIVPTMEQIQYSFREVAKQALPVVVEINTVEVVTQRIPRTRSPFDFFFGPGPQEGQPEEREFRQPGLGSGVIVRKDGNKIYVLTNNHVAGQASEISVSLYDGREFTGKLVGADPRRDLGVVVFETRDEVPVARLGNSDAVDVGDLVLAVGNPFGFESTITMGIVSAVGRQADASSSVANLTDYIQTDASINPGNSGGALVNLRGEVIGINTWIASQSGSSAGLGFAIPVNVAKKTVDEILSKGRVEYGWLGVQIVDLDPQRFPDYRSEFRIGEATGAFVANIFKGSPAFKAGVRPGDYITSIADQKVRDTSQLTRIVGNLPPGKDYDVQLIRDGRSQKLTIRLAIRAEDKEIAQQSANLWPGLYLAPITADLRRQLSIPETLSGVLVTLVQEGSPAAQAGFRQGDVIRQVEQKAVTKVVDFYQALNSGGGELAVRVSRQNAEVDLKLAR